MPAVKHHEERILLILTLLLVPVGVIMIYSASSVIALKKFGEGSYFLTRQLIWASAGVALLFVVSRIPYRIWQKWVIPLTLFSLILLGIVLVPGLGQEINGARRWLRNGLICGVAAEHRYLPQDERH